MKFLVVDDDGIICKGVEKRLMDMAHPAIEAVQCAYSAEEALALLAQSPYDIIITDIRMQDIDGLQLVERAKHLHADMRFIILTAYDHFQYAQQALRLGVSDFLLKPCSGQQMRDVVLRVINTLQADRDAYAALHPSLPTADADPIAQAKAYIHAHLDADCDMAVIANQLDISYSYFSKLFKEQTGKTFSEYSMQARMEEADRRLRAGQRVTQVALSLGYQNIQNFSRAYAKYFGRRPGAVRARG